VLTEHSVIGDHYDAASFADAPSIPALESSKESLYRIGYIQEVLPVSILFSAKRSIKAGIASFVK
jgi:hypothetical protein